MNEEALGCAQRSHRSLSPAHPRVEQRGPEHPPSSATCHSPLLLLQDLPSPGQPFAISRPLHVLVTARDPGPEGEKRRLTRVPSPAPSPLPSAPNATGSPGSTPVVTSCLVPAHVASTSRPRPPATGESSLEEKSLWFTDFNVRRNRCGRAKTEPQSLKCKAQRQSQCRTHAQGPGSLGKATDTLPKGHFVPVLTDLM